MADRLVSVISPSGEYGSVPESQLDSALQYEGYRLASAQEDSSGRRDAQLKQQYGDAPVQAGLYGAARGATFGLSDLVVDKEKANALKKFNPTASAIGEVGGSIASTALVPGGAELGAVAKVARAAIQGGLVGAGQGVSEAALGDDRDRTAEGVALSIGKQALWGSALGGALGAGGVLVERGAAKAGGGLSSLLEGQATKRAEQADVPAEILKQSVSLGERGRSLRAVLGDEGALSERLASHVESVKDSLSDIPQGVTQADDAVDNMSSWMARNHEALSSGKLSTAKAKEALRELEFFQGQADQARAAHGMVPNPPLDPDVAGALQIRAAQGSTSALDGLPEKLARKGGQSAVKGAAYAAGHFPGYIISEGTGLPELAGDAAASAVSAARDPLRGGIKFMSAIDRLSGHSDGLLSTAADGIATGARVAKDALPAASVELSHGLLADRIRTVDLLADDPQGSLSRMKAGMGPLAEHAPEVADGMAQAGLRAAQYLSQQAPRPPGPDPFNRWQAPVGAAARFHRLYDTLLDPKAALSRLASGDALPEEVDAIQNVYPKSYARLQQMVLDKVASDPKSVPPANRWLVSRFLGGTFDPISPSAGASIRASVTASQRSKQQPTQPNPASSVQTKFAGRFQSESEHLGDRS